MPLRTTIGAITAGTVDMAGTDIDMVATAGTVAIDRETLAIAVELSA